jgi:hypothetical protein
LHGIVERIGKQFIWPDENLSDKQQCQRIHHAIGHLRISALFTTKSVPASDSEKPRGLKTESDGNHGHCLLDTFKPYQPTLSNWPIGRVDCNHGRRGGSPQNMHISSELSLLTNL